MERSELLGKTVYTVCIYRDSPEEVLAAMREYIDRRWS